MIVNGYEIKPGAVLTYADLRGAVLTYADLRGAVLTYADLRGAVLTYADLRGADLRGADLRGTDLRGADLRGADLTGANLTDANLTGDNLTYADLTGANLTYANLTGANLTYANLTGAYGFRFSDAPDPATLRKLVADQIEQHPDLHDQKSWGDGSPDPSCGTACCVAGWACHLGGGARGQGVSSAATRLLWVDGLPMPSFDEYASTESILSALRAVSR